MEVIIVSMALVQMKVKSNNRLDNDRQPYNNENNTAYAPDDRQERANAGCVF